MLGCYRCNMWTSTERLGHSLLARCGYVYTYIMHIHFLKRFPNLKSGGREPFCKTSPRFFPLRLSLSAPRKPSRPSPAASCPWKQGPPRLGPAAEGGGGVGGFAGSGSGGGPGCAGARRRCWAPRRDAPPLHVPLQCLPPAASPPLLLLCVRACGLSLPPWMLRTGEGSRALSPVGIVRYPNSHATLFDGSLVPQ